MSRTPEGKVKQQVISILKKFGERVYYFMPVQTGYGMPTLDFIGACQGKAFAIETKAPGKKPTPRQIATMKAMEAAGVKVFLIDGIEHDYNQLVVWLYFGK